MKCVIWRRKNNIENYVHIVLFLPVSEYCAGKAGQKRTVSLSSCKSNFHDRVRAGIFRQFNCILFFPHWKVIVNQVYNKVKFSCSEQGIHSKHPNAYTEVLFYPKNLQLEQLRKRILLFPTRKCGQRTGLQILLAEESKGFSADWKTIYSLDFSWKNVNKLKFYLSVKKQIEFKTFKQSRQFFR